MTVRDFVRRLKDEDLDKIIVYRENGGWTNVWFEKSETEIAIIPDEGTIFSEDK